MVSLLSKQSTQNAIYALIAPFRNESVERLETGRTHVAVNFQVSVERAPVVVRVQDLLEVGTGSRHAHVDRHIKQLVGEQRVAFDQIVAIHARPEVSLVQPEGHVETQVLHRAVPLEHGDQLDSVVICQCCRDAVVRFTAAVVHVLDITTFNCGLVGNDVAWSEVRELVHFTSRQSSPKTATISCITINGKTTLNLCPSKLVVAYLA
ncbi:hypothetical protein D3C71_1239450 [compost metagenome]